MAGKAIALFDPKSFLVGAGRSTRSYLKNEVVYSQDELAHAVFYICKGRVKITVLSQHGKEAVIALLGPDDFFGEGCLAGQSRCMATAKAMAASTIVRVEKAAIVRLIHDEPAFSDMFIAHLLSRSIRIEQDLIDQLFNSSEKRLARMLLLLANYGKDAPTEPLPVKISQETLAEMIGTTRARVSFFMNKFRRLGFIDYNGRIKVHRSLLNVILHDEPQSGTSDRASGESGAPGRPS